MLQNPEHSEQPKPKEIIFDQYGLYIVTDKSAEHFNPNNSELLDNPNNTVLVSQPDWQSTLDVLSNTNFGRTTVLTPELITIAGLSLHEMKKKQEEIKSAIKTVKDISNKNKNTKFILGTPFFEEGTVLPFNSALVIEAGEIIARSDKKIITGDEVNNFAATPARSPVPMEGKSILVCRDLIGAQMISLQENAIGRNTNTNQLVNYIQLISNDPDFANAFQNAKFLAPNTSKLFIEACWGIGIPYGNNEKRPQREIDDAYFMGLRSYANSLLNFDPGLKQIIVCDRAPINVPDQVVTSKPLNAVFFKN